MKDVLVTNHNIQDLFEDIVRELDEHKLLMVSYQVASTGKWGMARLWRAWMSTTAKFMSQNGVTMPLMIAADGTIYSTRPFVGDDAHELFTRQHLGVDENNKRLSWAKSISKKNEDKERVATKGERFNALRKHEEWCSSRGVILLNPRDSEYQQLINEQDE